MKTRAGKVIMVRAQKPVVTFWKRNGASRESFYSNVIFGRVVQGQGRLVAKLHVVLSWTHSQDQDVHSVACTHVCVEATSVGLEGSNAIVTTQPCIIGRGRQTHTHREGNRRKPTVMLCFLVPLCVISIWGGLYNGQMWALTHRPFRRPPLLTEEHSSSPISPVFLIYLSLAQSVLPLLA